jgi:myosin heavy subunit
VTEPSIIRGSCLVDPTSSKSWVDSERAGKISSEQLWLDLGDVLSPRDRPSSARSRSTSAADSVQAQKHEAIIEDLVQAQALIQEQVERIQNLEQALDQSLAYAAEMRLQLIHQQFLENQLASTEEIANIQQQAITHLKKQLVQQQEGLESQKQELQTQSYTFQELLTTLTDFSQELTSPFDSSAAAPPNSGDVSETAPTASGQAITFLQTVRQVLGDRNAAIHQLETELHRVHTALQEQQALINTLQQASAQNRPLDKEFFSAHSKIQELETQLSKAITTQTILQHTYQETEQIRDRQQTRILELEHHAADMQEQILQQAQQASEYETAIQHWKDRYYYSRDYLMRFKELVEQFSQVDCAQTFSALSSELATLLAEIEPLTAPQGGSETSAIPTPLPTPRTSKMDLPDFLARRSRYRVRP